MITWICSVVEDESEQDFMIWIYQEHQELIHNIARQFVPRGKPEEDLVHEGLLRLLEKTETLRRLSRNALTGYISIAMRNTGINYRYKLQRQAGFSSEQDVEEIPTEEDLTMDELLILEEKRAQLAAIWPQLPEHDQFVLSGKYILEYTDAELAQQLDCKPASVRMKLTRARRRALGLLVAQEEAKHYEEK